MDAVFFILAPTAIVCGLLTVGGLVAEGVIWWSRER